MKQILAYFCLLACLLLPGCKEDAPAAPPPRMPQQEPPEPQKVESKEVQPDFAELVKNAEAVCRALEAEDFSFDAQKAAETMRLLRQNKQVQEAHNAFAELSAALRACWQKIREGNSPVPPDIRIQHIAQVLPLLKELNGDYEYRDAQFQIMRITEILAKHLEQAYGGDSRNDSMHERPKQSLLTALSVFDTALHDMAEDFWTAEKEQDFAKCVSIWIQVVVRVEEKHDAVVENIRNLMGLRLDHWREIYERQFFDSSDNAVKKEILQKVKPLFEFHVPQYEWKEKDCRRRFERMNEEYRKKLEEASRQQPVRRYRERPHRPRSRAEAEQMRSRNNIIRAIASGQPAMLDKALANGSQVEKIRINGRSACTFLLDNIQRGRRVDQNKVMIQILLRHGVKPTDAEMARIKEVIPEIPAK